MSAIRFRCPTCAAEVELDRRHLGGEVECGACLGVFVADPAAAFEPPPPGLREPAAEGDRPRSRRPAQPRRPRRRYDGPPPVGEPEPPASGAAVTALVLGILAVLSAPSSCFCPCVSIPLAVGAIGFGGAALLGRGGYGVATAGLVLGVIGLVMTAGVFAFGFNGAWVP